MERPTEVPAGRMAFLPESKVVGLFGRRGSGKSAAMALMAFRDWKYNSNKTRKIFYYPVDYGLKIPDAEAMSPEELISMPDRMDGSLILLDEMQELMSKFRTNTTSSLLMMAFLRQTRKRGANVVFTSNDPGGINRQVADQTDLHAQCQMLWSDTCKWLRYHRFMCTCTVRLRWKDTQGVHGVNPYKKDGRKGIVQHMVGIPDIFKYYNTASIADPMDVMLLTKNSLAATRSQSGLGMTWSAFDEKLVVEWIPMLVQQGFATLAPGNFVRVLKREEGITIDASQLGKRLAGVGLPRHRRKAGNIYKLPPVEDLDLWTDGVWEPDDDL